MKTFLILLIGVLLGVAGHIAWQSLPSSIATATGILQQEAKDDPAVSATYPSDFFVESRVYLQTASEEMVGQKVSAWGPLALATDPDAPSYPKIRNGKLTVVK